MGPLPRTQLLAAVLGLIEEGSELRMGEPLMRNSGDQRHGLGTRLAAPRGHHGCFVPVEDRPRVSEMTEFSEPCFQLFVRRHWSSPWCQANLIDAARPGWSRYVAD